LKDEGVLVVEPKSALTADDFQTVASAIDPHILDNGKLTALLTDALSFPGWESFGGLIGHTKFVRDHHRNIERIAVVTDSAILTIAPKIAEHFAHPEFKIFKSGERARAAYLAAGRLASDRRVSRLMTAIRMPQHRTSPRAFGARAPAIRSSNRVHVRTLQNCRIALFPG
jgi:hypothetical protein